LSCYKPAEPRAVDFNVKLLRITEKKDVAKAKKWVEK